MRPAQENPILKFWLLLPTGLLLVLQTIFPYLCGRLVPEWGGPLVIMASGLVSIAIAFACFVWAGRAIIIHRQFKLPLLVLAVVTLFGVSWLFGRMPGPRCFLIGLRQHVYSTMPREQWRELAKAVEWAAARTKSGSVFIFGGKPMRADTTEDEAAIAELNFALKKFSPGSKLPTTIYGESKSMDVSWGGGFGHWGFKVDFTTPVNFDSGRYIDCWASDPDVVFYMD
jgi:hypothetical protein